MKIYNKIILEWNEETQNYDNVVYEDSYEYDGELMLMHSPELVQIGTAWGGGNDWFRSCWMVKNLHKTCYNDGTAIPNLQGAESWLSTAAGAYCAYDNDEGIAADGYGYLYNWYAVDDSRGLCPPGFHVPDDEEWQYVGWGETPEPPPTLCHLKEPLFDHWVENQWCASYDIEPFEDNGWANGYIDEIGFELLGSGLRSIDSGASFGQLMYTFWGYSADEQAAGSNNGRAVTIGTSNAGQGEFNQRNLSDKRAGTAVRCIANQIHCNDVPASWGAVNVSSTNCTEGTPCTVQLEVFDDACMCESNLPFTFSAASSPLPSNGTVSGYGSATCAQGSGGTTKSVTFTPAMDFAGYESWTYQVVCEDTGETATATASVSYTGTIDIPVCLTTSATVAEDSLATDEENAIDITCTTNAWESIEYEILEENLPLYGTLNGWTQPPLLTYAPDVNFHGIDTFTYTAEADHGGITSQTVIITVGSVMDAPICYDVDVEINEGQSATVVFQCDPGGGEFYPDAITNWTVSTLSPSGGTITSGCTTADNCGPLVVFMPTDIDWNESTIFTYTACAGNECSESAEVNISAVGQPDEPSGCTGLVDSIGPFDEDSSANQFTISCTAPSYEDMEYYIVHPADVGTLYVSIDEEDEAITSPTEISGTTATLDYIPLTDQNYDAEFSYFAYATDGGYTYVEATIGITAGADSPACPYDALTVWEESSSNPFSIACTAPNEYEEITSYEITAEPVSGSLMYDSIPTMFYTPDANFEGADSFEYTATATDGGTTDVVFNITVEDVSDQPIWIYVDTGIGIINEYESTNVTGWAEDGAAIYEDIDGEITFQVSPPPGYDCMEIFWTVESESFFDNGSLDFQSGFGCTNILDLMPNLDWNTYSLVGDNFVDNPIDVIITATPDGGETLSLTFPVSVVPTSDLPVAPDMYAGSDYYDGEGMDPGLDWNFLSFIWHKTGIDESEQESVCGDGDVGWQSDNKCIYDPDPWDNNVWWTEEHRWICDTKPTFDYQCSESGTCGPGNNYDCIETTPMYTYQAVEVKSWNQWGVGAHGGFPELWIDGRCDNALVPITYMKNETQGNATIEITEGMLPFTFPTDQEIHVPYFMDDVGGISKNLELTYQCEGFGLGGYIEEPIDFEITYRVVECMYFTTDDGAVDHWGLPYCAESDELGWECDDDNSLKCSPYGEMWVEASVVGTRAGFGLGGGGRSSESSLTFSDQSVVTGEWESIVSWHWDFGDGETSDQQNPTHEYPEPDYGGGPGEWTGERYTVQLTIEVYESEYGTSYEKTMQREVAVIGKRHMAGWNLVSAPVEAYDMHHTTLFGEDTVPQTLFGFDVAYQSENDLEVGKGYWLRFTSTGSSTMAGFVPKIAGHEAIVLDLPQGWSFIGGLPSFRNWNSVYVSDPDEILIPGTLYEYGIIGYSSVGFMWPGKGYWIKTNQTGTISIHEFMGREGGELPAHGRNPSTARYNVYNLPDGFEVRNSRVVRTAKNDY